MNFLEVTSDNRNKYNLDFLGEISRDPEQRGFHWSEESLTLGPPYQLWIALENHQISGLIYTRSLGETLEILCLVTHPKSRRQGVAKGLIAYLMVSSKCREIQLEVHEKNLSALELYKKQGFISVGFRPGYYGDGGGAILMTKALLP